MNDAKSLVTRLVVQCVYKKIKVFIVLEKKSSKTISLPLHDNLSEFMAARKVRESLFDRIIIVKGLH